MPNISWKTYVTGAGVGVLAAGAGVAVGSGVAAVITGAVSPIISVGNRAIDMAPPFLKDFAVEKFGENDKVILIGGVVVVVFLVAALAGLVGVRFPRVATAITLVLGAVAVFAGATDRTATASTAVQVVPAILTLVVSVAAIVWLLAELGHVEDQPRAWLAPHPGDEVASGFDRRKFLTAAMATGAVVVVGGVVTRVFGGSAAAASRADVVLPSAAEGAGAIPAGVHPEVNGLSSYITPNADFYRVDTAVQVPDLPADSYNLRIHGLVDRELNLSFADLLDRRLIERRITMTCVSNQVGGPYVGNAVWLGIPMRELLAEAGVQDGADAVKSTSVDDMVIGTPLTALTDDRDALVVVGMNGEPLPLEHGFPVRMITPGLYGYVGATKWLIDLEVTSFSDFTSYWQERDWAEQAPIKMSSRIDVPTGFQELPADNAVIAGVAWAQTIGVEKVEVKIDDGDWNEVELAAEDNIDTWRQWSWRWEDATAGLHKVTVRATDATGFTQVEEREPTRPDGSTGWQAIDFTIA